MNYFSKLKKIPSRVVLLSALMMALLTPAAALAAPDTINVTTASSSTNASVDAACEGIKAAGGNCDKATGQKGFNDIIITIINILSVVVGAISVIMIIVGGLRYIISAGDSNGVQGAKNTILYALVGLVIVLFSQVIVRFVLVQFK